MGAALMPPSFSITDPDTGGENDMYDDDEDIDIEEHLAPEVDLIEEDGPEDGIGGEDAGPDDDSGLVVTADEDGIMQDDDDDEPDYEINIPVQAVLT
jgi:hypothetical protein